MRTHHTAAAGAGGCLLAGFGFCVWCVAILVALCVKIGIIAAIIAGVYWCFTGEWIGDAPFLN